MSNDKIVYSKVIYLSSCSCKVVGRKIYREKEETLCNFHGLGEGIW